MRHDPASGAIVIVLRSLKMHGMAQAVTDLIEQAAPAFETAVPVLAVIETFKDKHGTRSARGASCLSRDNEALLAFCDAPRGPGASAHLEPRRERVCHPPIPNRPHQGTLSQKIAKLVVFTPVRAASKKWRKFNGTNQLPGNIEGIRVTDGVIADDASQSRVTQIQPWTVVERRRRHL